MEESTDPSFSPFHITRVDRAYNIQCAYQEPERMLSTQIDVRLAFVSPSPITKSPFHLSSPPPTIQISNQMQTPQCEYRIHGQASADQVGALAMLLVHNCCFRCAMCKWATRWSTSGVAMGRKRITKREWPPFSGCSSTTVLWRMGKADGPRCWTAAAVPSTR